MEGAGRPTIMTPETLQKLETAFLNGASDKEACFVANIAQQTLYNYQKDHPEFVERKEGLKDFPKYQAKLNIISRIAGGDVPVSQWYAERKIKEEFSTRNDLNLSGDLTSKIISVDE